MNNTPPSFTQSVDEAFAKVKSGEWTSDEFNYWYTMKVNDAYNHGYDNGYIKGYDAASPVQID